MISAVLFTKIMPWRTSLSARSELMAIPMAVVHLRNVSSPSMSLDRMPPLILCM